MGEMFTNADYIAKEIEELEVQRSALDDRMMQLLRECPRGTNHMDQPAYVAADGQMKTNRARNAELAAKLYQRPIIELTDAEYNAWLKVIRPFKHW